MKTFQAFLVAEFRRALPFLPWLLGLHAMTLGARTRWAGEVSNQLVGMIEWASWAIASLLAVISLWHDAPLRRERFLSTRPQCFMALLAAKWIALLLLVALPFGIVDFLALKSNGFSAKFLWLGTLQTLLLFLAALCALFPAVWWWRSVPSAFTALGVTFAALILTGSVLAKQTGNRNLHSGEALGFPLGPLLVLAFLAALVIISTALLPLLRKNKDIIRIPAFAIFACLSLWLGLWVSIRPPKADEIVTPSIVAVRRISPGYQKMKYEWFNARAPSTPPDADIDVVWSFSKLEIDGRNLSPWTRRGPSNAPGSFQIHSALVRKLGNTFLNPRAEPAYHFPTIAILPTEVGPLSALDIAFDLSETHYRWEVVVDIPLREGASAQLTDCRWIIDYYRPEIALQADGNVRTDTVLEVGKYSVDLWLQTKPHWNPHHRLDDDSPCIVDPITGAVYPIGFDARGFSIGSASDRGRRFQSWDIGSWLRSASVGPPRELRFVVLRPTAVRRISHRWKSPGPVDLEQGSAGDLAETARDKARRGLAGKVSPILLEVPQDVGLTETEWLEYFRLNPMPGVYHSLVGQVLSREQLDRAVDEILHGFRIRPSAHSISPGLDLALARGRPEAPRWLKEDLEARIAASNGPKSSGVSFQILENHFILPEQDIIEDRFLSRERQLEWFLAADPDGFEFDPATRKYQPRNDP